MLPDPDVGPSAPIWPSSSGRLTVDPAVLTQIARALDADIQAVKSVWDNLVNDGLVTSIDTGLSDAAYGLGEATGNVYSGISQYLDELIAAQQAVIDRINQSAAAYADTEANTTALVNSVRTGGSVPSGGTLTSGTATGAGSWAGGTTSGGSLGSGPAGSLAGSSPPPSGGVGTLPGPGAPGLAGPAPGGSPVSPISPIAPFPVPGGAARGSLPGEPEAGEPVPGELVPGEPVEPMAVGEPVIGGPVAEDPVIADPVAGEPVVGEPVIGGRGAAMLGGGTPAEMESAALGERSLANGLGIIGEEDGPMLAESPAAGGVLGVGAADDAAVTGEAGGFMPVGGAGGERDREHTTWLTEDGDVWSGNDDVAPPVIGDGGR